MQQDTYFRLTRPLLGQWAGFVAGFALLVGVLALIWLGGLNRFVISMFVTGGVGLLVWAGLAPGDVRSFVTGRQARYSTGAVFSTLLLVGIVVLAYIVIERAVLTVDMTTDQAFTLSTETRTLLNRVNRPVRITGFYSPRSIRLREVDDQYFRQYEIESEGLIGREYIDPDEQPAVAQAFGVVNDGAVFVSFLNPDGTIDFDTVARVPRGARQERDMTNAISRLLLSGTFTVYFDAGHGELDLLDDTQQGLSGINNGMRENGLITGVIDLSQLARNGDGIPADASTLILARPTTPLSAAEIDVVDAYMQRGGSLFIMTDPLFADNAFLTQDSAFNAWLWENYGIRALDAVVVDNTASERTPLDVISAAVFAESDIAQRLDPAESPTLFRIARALEVNFDDPPVNGGQVIASSPQSYGETNLRALADTNTFTFDAGEDLPGPVSTVVWAWDQNTDARILMVGDGEFASNGQVINPIGNSILFTDGLGWLTRFGESTSIEFGEAVIGSSQPLLFVSGQMLDTIGFVTIFVIPGVVLLIGLGIGIRRGRR